MKKCMHYLWFVLKMYLVIRLSYLLTLVGLATYDTIKEMKEEEE